MRTPKLVIETIDGPMTDKGNGKLEIVSIREG